MNVKKRYGGGGGQTVTPTIPDWAVPAIQNVQGQAEGMYGSGDLSRVASSSPLQDAAFGGGAQAIAATGGAGLDTLQGQQQRLAGMAATPSSADLAAKKADILFQAQKGVAGLNTGFGEAGTLGSGRQAVMQGAQNAETTGKLAQVDSQYEQAMFQNRLAAESALGQSVSGSGALASGTASGLANLGQQQRGISQQQADAPWQGLQRYASTIYGNPARQQASSGGK